MVLVNQYIIRLVLNAGAPPDAMAVINQALPDGWEVVGSTLEAPHGTSSAEASMIVLDLADKIDWLFDCVTNMDLLRVVEVVDLKRLFNQMQIRPE